NVVCVSANPALDRRLHLPAIALGEVNRARSAATMPGGKSAHVAMTARALGARAIWIGFSGGATGDENEAGLTRLGLAVHPIRTSSATRTNLEVIEESGRITEILEPGERIGAADQQELLRLCEKNLSNTWKGAVLAISGSLPPGVAPELYRSLIRLARTAGPRAFLDASGDALRESLGAEPDFVKPNRREAEQLLGGRFDSVESTVAALSALIDRGARSAAITLGAEGLIWKTARNGECWLAKPPKLKPISTVGCGDAALGGFAYAAQTGLTSEESIRLAAACGAANCLAQLAGQITEDDVKKLSPQIEVTRLAS
ncbi:MAG: 1-phosphofructokinase family hexose kinase, partial [Candidatus Acidiferrales bacterium]